MSDPPFAGRTAVRIDNFEQIAPGRPGKDLRDGTDPAAGLAAQRRAFILAEVARHGGVRVTDLSRALRVSDMTIRRDLDTLARQCLVTKVHGGATGLEIGSTVEPGFGAKSVRDLGAKRAIARAAARLVQPGSAIALTAGATTWLLATHLATVPALTVVTNSLHVAEVLYRTRRPDQTVILTGGTRTPSDALVGPVAVASIRALRVDLVFLGVHGVDAQAGLTTPNMLEAETNRAFVAAARRLVVVADHTKWSVVGLSQIAALEEVDTFVTDRVLGPAREALAERVGEVILAGGEVDAPGAQGPGEESGGASGDPAVDEASA
jgi:DeoR/GlpR family transcriptional regulator of sugar metabolism